MGFFSRQPLNAELLARRRAQFDRWAEHPPAELADYVLAARTLQRINRRANADCRFDRDALLGLRLNVPSTAVESDLWTFVRRYWHQCVASGAVTRAYVLTGTVDLARGLELVTAHYRHSLHHSAPDTGAVVALALRLMRRNDYHGCFKLVDATLCSRQHAAWARGRQRWAAGLGAGAFAVAAVAQALVLPMWECVPMVAIELGAAGATVYGVGRIFAADMPRVSWRPHTSLLHRWLRRGELEMANRIVTHFEEHREVNVKNFHLALVRPVASTSTVDQYDYEMQLPQGDADEAGTLARYIRGELHGRKMRWNALREEEDFLAFWVSHGESFEWVEPDQDPAEIVHFAGTSEETNALVQAQREPRVLLRENDSRLNAA